MELEGDHASQRLHYQMNALVEVSKTLTVSLDLPELLDHVLYKIVEVIPPAEAVAVMLWDQSAGLFRPVAAVGFDFQIFKQIGLRAGEAITGKVFDSQQICLITTPVEIQQAMADMRPANQVVFSRALGTDQLPLGTLGAPIAVAGQEYGVLIINTIRGPAVLTREDLPFIQTIADLIGMAIDRARLEAKADSIHVGRETERLRAELMATLSHELRLPLTAIKGYTSALLMEDVAWGEAKRREFLKRAVEECESMEVMIREILDSSIIDVSQLNLDLEPIRLQNLARDVVAEIQRRIKTHRIIVDYPADFPLVDGDPHWIKQVYRNILDNAIKYSPDGGLVVVRGETRANDVVIHIADQGIGISPEDLIPLFEKFFRVRSALHYHVSGTGLGLPNARAIIEAHGGRIWVESKVGQGTTVFFSLPKAAPLPVED
jgi:signal transduction histidine kinase